MVLPNRLPSLRDKIAAQAAEAAAKAEAKAEELDEVETKKAIKRLKGKK